MSTDTQTDQKQPKQDQDESKGCPQGQHKNADGKCVPDKTDAIDDPIIKDGLLAAIAATGNKVPKENCDSIPALKQFYIFAKANPKEVEKTDSTPPPELPPAADRDKKDEKADSEVDIFSLKIDSIIGENVTQKAYTPEMDQKLQDHMDSLANGLFNFSTNPIDEIEPAGNENFTKQPHQSMKSSRFDSKESKVKRKVDEKRAAEIKRSVKREKAHRSERRKEQLLWFLGRLFKQLGGRVL